MAKRKRRQQRDHQDHDEGFGSFVAGAVLGGLAGALAAFWFAPQSGQEMRRELQERSSGLVGDIEHAASKTRRRFEGDTMEDAMREGREEARRFQQPRG